jgi:hypothetical protein
MRLSSISELDIEKIEYIMQNKRYIFIYKQHNMDTNDPNDLYEPPHDLQFPKTINHKIWVEYLGRQLYQYEKYLLEDYRAEKCMNNMMKDLYTQCKDKTLFVPMLTNLDGNCMFESLIYHGIGNSVMEIRRILSILMYVYKDYKGFLPNIDMTLTEIFNMANEIEYVVSKQKEGNETVKKFYKYTYNVMCQDLSNNHSWSRLPTQLILMVLSYIYKLEFVIIGSNSSYENKVNVHDSIQNIKKIYLGHLGESHYVPLDILTDDYDLDPLFYSDAKIALIKWAEAMEKIKIEKYTTALKIKKIEEEMNNEPEKKSEEEEKFQSIDFNKLSDNNEIYMVDFNNSDDKNESTGLEDDKTYMVYM